MVKTAFNYVVRKSSLPNGNSSNLSNWDVFKVDEDMNAASSYRVIEGYSRKTKDDGTPVVEYFCSCPAYKNLCKHVVWVKSLKLHMQADEAITGGRFNPATNGWTFEKAQHVD